MTTALYLRISVDDDNSDESNSVVNQRDLLRRFVKADPVLSTGHILEFIDDGWSGTNFERPQVKKLLDLARRGGVQCIIVKDVSRWGRNYVEVCEYLDQIFPFLGIRFISLGDSYDSEAHQGRTTPMDIAFSSLIHDIYSKDLSQKVRQSYFDRTKKGEYLCGNAPFGFVKSAVEKNRLVIDEEAAMVVRRIFDLACEGESTTQIAAALNGDGVDTPYMYLMRKGRVSKPNVSAVNDRTFWTDDTIRKILYSQNYIGVQISGRYRAAKPGSSKRVRLPESEWIRVPGAHEAIVTEEIFDRANKTVSHFKLCTPRKRRLFSGKMRCGYCGRTLSHRAANLPYYYCNGTRLNSGMGCSNDKLYVDDLIALTLHAVKTEAQKVLDTHRKQREMKVGVAARDESMAELKMLNTQIGSLERHGVSLYEDFVEGSLSRDDYLAAKTECATELDKANARVAELNGHLNAASVNNDVPCDEPLLRRVLDAGEVTGEVLTLIDRIVMYEPERIEIYFSFGDTNAFELNRCGGGKRGLTCPAK